MQQESARDENAGDDERIAGRTRGTALAEQRRGRA
jgi:hypothetical protein